MVLTTATSDHAGRLIELDSDPEVMRHINGGRPTTRADAERRLRDAAGFMFIATDASSDEFLGWFSIRPSTSTERELGYRLRRAVWGRGLATEGALEMIGFAFADPMVERVWAQTMTVNTASRRVMERSAMRFVRTFVDDWPEGPIEGSDLGDVEYELRRTDWRPLPIGDGDPPVS
jgi:RimJ/RimL family protein N-acetyltransferase